MKKTFHDCEWPGEDALMRTYHDEEWGVPVYADRKIFEFLVLESMQAGLSWRTILHKRKNFKKAFANFGYKKIARFKKRDVARLLQDAGIIRNRLKILAVIHNAEKFMEVQKEFGSFSNYMWGFVHHKPIQGNRKTMREIPAVTAEAIVFAQDLKKRGFKFLGPTVVYAHMQAVGMANDHIVTCHCYKLAKRTF